MGEFKVTVPRTYTFREGWGVSISPVWSYDERTDEPDNNVSDIEVGVVRIAADTTSIVGGVPCVSVWPNAWVPVENFQDVPDLTDDDQHDLRTRWFATETQAREHAMSTQWRFEHPQPWESFVTLH